jgi:uncharacterized protein YkwD
MIYAIIIAVLGFGYLIYSGAKKKQTDLVYTDYKPTIQNYNEDLYNLLSIINIYRAENNLQTVIPDVLLTELAEEHTSYMFVKGKASHDNYPLRLKEILENNFKATAELTSYGYTSNESLFKAYLKSPKHKEKIDSNDFNYIGIAKQLDSKGKIFNTIIFGFY